MIVKVIATDNEEVREDSFYFTIKICFQAFSYSTSQLSRYINDINGLNITIDLLIFPNIPVKS